MNINLDELQEDRYARLRLIPWWDQEKLKNAKVMVVGAGAIGNEILKNLALLGVGTIIIVDLDRIENSNLSRAVLFRESDENKSKAFVAAERVREINPEIKTIPIEGSIITEVGKGFFRHVDLVLAGLDNREARLSINQKCWKTNTPWIDGAIEVFQGFARVFIPPDSACYECTMNEADYRLLNFRKSCSLLTRKQMEEGKVPTTPTTASVIAGIQVQEAVKLLHPETDLQPLAGKGFVFNGLSHDSYVVTYPIKENCLSHESWEPIQALALKSEETTIKDLVFLARNKLKTKEVVIETDMEMAIKAACHCGKEESLFRPLTDISLEEATCTSCGEEREIQMTHSFYGDEPYAPLTLQQIGFPPGEIFQGRSEEGLVYLEMTGDVDSILKR
ncbi:HesA/MoeB/ThiF family protein [Tindallia californiensis]|uniref:Adenylyltransferase and sulfurtransferase n=1 Tax=Tindallia californiensis TaxID=159292 RepID=A0A1H3KJ66_9FIRM|nr:ThiF family adenylyltransferase [Tindallia californiensis]SDY52262.1 adenylyltransferase and sulfurtransferase [Tindallia californiensis]